MNPKTILNNHSNNHTADQVNETVRECMCVCVCVCVTVCATNVPCHLFIYTDLMNVIHRMLHPDPKYRATVKEVQDDTWVTQPIDIDTYSWEQVIPNCGMLKVSDEYMIVYTQHKHTHI